MLTVVLPEAVIVGRCIVNFGQLLQRTSQGTKQNTSTLLWRGTMVCTEDECKKEPAPNTKNVTKETHQTQTTRRSNEADCTHNLSTRTNVTDKTQSTNNFEVCVSGVLLEKGPCVLVPIGVSREAPMVPMKDSTHSRETTSLNVKPPIRQRPYNKDGRRKWEGKAGECRFQRSK